MTPAHNLLSDKCLKQAVFLLLRQNNGAISLRLREGLCEKFRTLIAISVSIIPN